MNFEIWIILAFGHLLTWLLIPRVLLRRNSQASASVAWILSILFLPYIGAMLFLIFGNTQWKRSARRRREASVEQDRAMAAGTDAPAEPPGADDPLARLATSLTGAALTAGNDAEHMPSTERSIERLAYMLEQAQHYIHIEFYIVRRDDVGQRIGKLLKEKARQGVDVRLLYDGIGSMLLTHRYLKSLKDAGVRVAPFTPGFRSLNLLALNIRNHRKLVVVDGRVGFTGGMNIGEEYIHRTKSYGKLRDTQLLFRGPAVLQLQRVFARDWYYATGESLNSPMHDADAPDASNNGDGDGAVRNVQAQVIADGPDDDENVFYALFTAAIARADRSVSLCTPYFVPPDGVAVALETAARRGVRTRLLLARRGNFTWTLMAGRACYDRLINAGVEIYEYEEGLYHPKTLTVDERWSLVGTANCDYRSLFLNFEVALALFDGDFARELERQFDRDCKSASRVEPDPWRRRSRLRRLHEQFWRLFAPSL